MRQLRYALISGVVFVFSQYSTATAQVPIGDCWKKENQNKPECKALLNPGSGPHHGAEADSVADTDTLAAVEHHHDSDHSAHDKTAAPAPAPKPDNAPAQPK